MVSAIHPVAIVAISLTVGILLGAGATLFIMRAASPVPVTGIVPTPTLATTDASAGAACVDELRNQVHVQPGTEPHIDAVTEGANGMWAVKLSVNTSESVRAQYLCALQPVPNSSQWQPRRGSVRGS